MFLPPADVAERIIEVRGKCEAAGRDPESMRFSVYTRDEDFLEPGPARVDLIRAYADAGVDRIVCFPTRRAPTTETQERFAQDCVAAGIDLES